MYDPASWTPTGPSGNEGDANKGRAEDRERVEKQWASAISKKKERADAVEENLTEEKERTRAMEEELEKLRREKGRKEEVPSDESPPAAEVLAPPDDPQVALMSGVQQMLSDERSKFRTEIESINQRLEKAVWGSRSWGRGCGSISRFR